MPIKTRPLSLLAALLCLWISSAHATPGWNGQFEHMKFSVSWLFVPAGTAIIQAIPQKGDDFLLESQACTNATVDLVHKVRDRITAYSHQTADGYRSRAYHMRQLESWYSNTMDLLFRNDKVIVKDLKTGRTRSHDVVKDTVDMLTALYETRRFPLSTRGRYTVPVIDRHKQYQLAVDVLRREKIDTVFGDDTPTIVIQPRLQSEGIFRRTAGLIIWLTDDERRIPVKMTSKIKIGSIVTELVDYTDGKTGMKKLADCPGIPERPK